MPRRRPLLLGAGAGLLALAGCASPKPKTPLIGHVTNVSARDAEYHIDGLRVGLREHGLVEGESLRMEWRFGDGSNDRMPALVADLLSRNVDLILAAGGAPAFVREATDRVPIVVIGGAGLVERGLAASLSRPGGNLTGIQNPVELGSKGFELLHQVVPTARKVAHFITPTVIASRVAVQDVVQRLGLELFEQTIHVQADLEPAFERAAAWGADVLWPANVVPLNNPRELVPNLALKYRLPAGGASIAWTAAGMLLSYSANEWHAGRRAANYAARILNGANPAELPIEILSEYDVAVHRGTLAALGLHLAPEVASQVTRWFG
jgi:putative tryptophan/tyrosine transport system substrate-binding protein